MKKILTMLTLMGTLGALQIVAMQSYQDPVRGDCIKQRLRAWWHQRMIDRVNNELLKVTAQTTEDLAKVRSLIAAGASVQHTSIAAKTPLHNAVYQKHSQIAEFLINQGANVDTQDAHGRTCMHSAVYEGAMSIIELLIKFHALIDVQDRQGWAPLHFAIYNRDALALLLTQKPLINIQTIEGETPLHLAVYNGNADVFKLLLEQNPLIDMQTTKGQTPLHLAIDQNHTLIAKMLLEHQASIEAQNGAGQRPLHYAADKDNVDVLKTLLSKYDVLLDVHDNRGQTPFHYAAQQGNVNALLCLICKSFFQPRWNEEKVQEIIESTKVFQRDRVKKILESLKKFNEEGAERIDKKGICNLMIILNDEKNAAIIADLVPLYRQQEMLTWKNKGSQKNTHTMRKTALVTAHSNRHFEKLQQILAHKDVTGKTALDVAVIKAGKNNAMLNAPQLLKDIIEAHDMSFLFSSMRESITNNIRSRLELEVRPITERLNITT